MRYQLPWPAINACEVELLQAGGAYRVGLTRRQHNLYYYRNGFRHTNTIELLWRPLQTKFGQGRLAIKNKNNKKDGYRQRNVRQFLQSAEGTLFGYLTRVKPVCRCLQAFCGWRHLATSRESKAHFGLPWVHSWDNRSKCYMDGKRIQFNACQTHRSMYYLQPFPSNSTRNFKSSPF